MPYLFFVIIIAVPFLSVAYFSATPTGVLAHIATFLVPAITVGFLFRARVEGGAYVVSEWSFGSYPLLGVSAGLSALAALSTVHLIVSGIFLAIASLATIWVMREGPVVYGWDACP
ncbi:MAG: hypothetical protein KC877_00015 [Candidatus Kaiserbacteria bacterium]|nr:hypothetical protein [Candidatus Kaiserbacteria bacterium]MCB9816613.1 hypothetical protein [Candidatus Nomurabacteria bacterium]